MKKVHEIIAAVFSWAATADIMKKLENNYENGLCDIEINENNAQITFCNKRDYDKFIIEIVGACLYDGIGITIYETFADIYTDSNYIEIQMKGVK